MPPWLGGVLAALGIFLTAGLLTIVGTAVRESGLPPGEQPDAVRRRRGRIAIAIAGIVAALALWGGNVWWGAEASAYSRSVLYRPFNAEASLGSVASGLSRTLRLSIKDPRWTGKPFPQSMYNALTPDHGKLMHLFLVRDDDTAIAHLHPIASTPAVTKRAWSPTWAWPRISSSPAATARSSRISIRPAASRWRRCRSLPAVSPIPTET